jgi:hypothetical protein
MDEILIQYLRMNKRVIPVNNWSIAQKKKKNQLYPGNKPDDFQKEWNHQKTKRCDVDDQLVLKLSRRSLIIILCRLNPGKICDIVSVLHGVRLCNKSNVS